MTTKRAAAPAIAEAKGPVYTFLSATYANEQHSAAVAITEEAAAVALSEDDTPEQWTALLASGITIAAAAAPTGSEVNAERARRILRGTIVTVPGAGQILLQGRDEDARNLQALAFAASLRVDAGDTTTLTTFHDAENVDHKLTPPQMLALWQAAAAYVSALYAASWAIKAMDPIPADFRDNDDLWPI